MDPLVLLDPRELLVILAFLVKMVRRDNRESLVVKDPRDCLARMEWMD